MEEITQGGRPKEGLESLPPLWKENILYAYSLGASDVEIKAWIYGVRGSFSNDLWDRWIKEEREFWETISSGRMIAEAFYHKIGRENLTNPRFNHQAWYLHMKNRFSWKDKLDITTGNEPINQLTEKEVDKKINDLIRKVAAARPDSADEESPA
ncbi:hypothetical protein GXP67_21180 [Rhodocytophaga rosea]|uniref:Uncharacterized protein n=1 Tax=Rhodocytophaga rosea TaxID=2704465 RepID=A0A6C0GMD1_9BACT|nr:hypothetical protein [Rhodocytophaga rosea]QHT68984.1 hypothetical protein GXP67_21180 [Rhodocytophaga rosea]